MSTQQTSRKMSNADYHAHPSIGSSMAKTFRQSRRQYFGQFVERNLADSARSDAMDLGTVAHAAILEPHIIEDLIVEITPEVLTSNGQRRGKAWDAFAKENEGKILFAPGDIRRVRAMQAACYKHPIAGALLRREGPTEDSLFIECNKSGLQRKCRIDKHTDDFIVDLKTTADASPAGFARTIANLDYEFSAAWYVDVTEQFTGQRKDFVWIVVSVEPPHAVRVYNLLPEDELTAWNAMESTLYDLAGCYDSGDWSEPGENEVVGLGLPVWKKRNQWEVLA